MKRILIVEDNELVSLTLEKLLKNRGYEVAVASDAVGALDMARRFEPDMVLLDISIPAGNGFEVAERVKRFLPRPAHLMFLTASVDPMLKDKARRLGAVGFLQKSCTPQELLEAIQNVFCGIASFAREEVYAI